MGIPLTPILWGAACLPIVVLLLLMVRWRWGAAEAAPVALLTATLSGIFLYQAPLTLIAGEVAKGIWNSIAIITVVFPAILIFEVTVAAGAIEPFRRGMQQFSPNELLRVLAVGWIFVSFLQGVTGFGVPVAVGAPLLMGIGVVPIWAVIFSLIGQAWGNTFGTLAIAWDALVSQAGLTDASVIQNTALLSALFIWLIDLAAGLLIAWFYGGRKAIVMGLPAIIVLSVIHGGGQLLLTTINPTVSNFVASCAALAAVLWLGRISPYNKPYANPASQVMSQNREQPDAKAGTGMSLAAAFLPYFILVVITLSVLLITPLQNALSFWKLGVSFPATSTGFGFVNKAVASYSPIVVFTHAGTFLLLAAVGGWLVYLRKGYIRPQNNMAIVFSSLQKTLPSAIAVFGLVAMSKVMAGTGQTDVLARGMAEVTGVWYVLAAPFIGITGSFMTSSNMSSNILFAGFQGAMAGLLKIDKALLLAAQTAGGAIGSIIAPSKILLGTATAGIAGAEGQAMSRMLPFTLALGALIGLITFAGHWLS